MPGTGRRAAGVQVGRAALAEFHLLRGVVHQSAQAECNVVTTPLIRTG